MVVQQKCHAMWQWYSELTEEPRIAPDCENRKMKMLAAAIVYAVCGILAVLMCHEAVTVNCFSKEYVCQRPAKMWESI